MSEIRRLLKGVTPPSPSDWTNHFVCMHDEDPGKSEKNFRRFVSNYGQTSYALLAQTISSSSDDAPVILDMGCGSGVLVEDILNIRPKAKIVGIDLSGGEIELAKKRYSGACTFIQADGIRTGMDSDRFDYVLSHMALMLMYPIESAIREIHRILRNGGMLCAVIGNPVAGEGAFKEIQLILKEEVKSAYPNYSTVSAIDIRTQSEDGLNSLFNEGTGFMVPKLLDFHLAVESSGGRYWSYVKSLYQPGLLSKAALEGLRKRIDAVEKVYAGDKLRIPLRLVISKKISLGVD